MSPTDDDRITGVMRPGGDSPEATLVERVAAPVPADAAVDRNERDYCGDEGTVRMEPEAAWGPLPPETVRELAPQALHASDHVALPDTSRGHTKRSTSWPGWVLPYLIACVTLVLTGLFVLWTQARILGHF